MQDHKAWIHREMNIIRKVSATIKAAGLDEADYDEIDMLLDLLASTLIEEVREYLYEEFKIGYEEVAGFEPEMYEADRSAYHEVEEMTFEDRIREYMAESDAEDFSSETLQNRMKALIMTDGHRVRNEAEYAAGQALQRVGYIVTKTWRDMRDEKVRDTHFLLHSTTLPLDEYFHTENGKALYPGGFGVAKEDCNCRCVLDITAEEGEDI